MRHLLLKRILLGLLIIGSIEGLFRLVFAVGGYKVGTLVPTWMYFKPVDTLIVNQEYYMDELGVYRARGEFWKTTTYKLNCEDFRGREFDTTAENPSATRLLFIGDSFTWGAHCDSNFIDMLNHLPNFACYNTGIPGNDPAQYQKVAEVYIPKLKPDYTVLMLFLGNDLMDAPRNTVPNSDLYFQTNAGWLPSYHEGRFFKTAQESYNFIAEQYTTTSLWKKLLMKSAIGTACIALPLRIKEYSEWKKKSTSKVTNLYLRSIRDISQIYSELLIFIIPSLQEDMVGDFYNDPEGYVKKNYPNLITGIEDITYVLPMRPEQYWPLPDGHFNYEGHAAVAAFIASKIKERAN